MIFWHAEYAEPKEACRTLVLRRIAIPKILRILREKDSQREKSEIDAEAETDWMHLHITHVKEWQQGIVGKETNVVATHAERGIQLELVHLGRIVILDLRPVGKLHPIPLRKTQASRHTRIDVHVARRADFKHQWHLQKQRTVFRVLYDLIGVNRDNGINHIFRIIFDGDVIVPTEIVPADTHTRKQTCSMFSVECDAHIGDVEAEIPTTQRPKTHPLGPIVRVHRIQRHVEQHIQARLKTIPVGIEKEVLFHLFLGLGCRLV